MTIEKNSILVLLLVGALHLAAASHGHAELRAGAATSNITLPLGAANGGVISKGSAARQIHDDLHARCLVFDDGQTTIAIAVCDLRMIDRGLLDEVKDRVEKATGIPPGHVLISATHTHAAPGVIGIHTSETDLWYREFLIGRIADGIVRSHRSLAPARVGWGRASIPGQIFNRRWHMKEGSIPPNPFGDTSDRVRFNPPSQSPDLVEPAGPVDPDLFLLSVQHADGRPLALLGNYGVHYIGGYQGGSVSADYFAIFANRMTELLGVHTQDPPFVGILSNGTSGDTNNRNFRAAREKKKPWEKMREVAFELADEAMGVLGEMEYRSDLSLAAASVDLNVGVRRPDAERIAWANRTLETPAGIDSPKKIHAWTAIYAREALELAEYPETLPVPLQAFRIGELGIGAIPCEVFAETGLAIKKESPLEDTFTIELANGYNGYLPTPRQHEWGGYETWPARSSCLEVEAEPAIRAKILELLGKVAGE